MKVAGDYVKGEWGKVKCEKAGFPRHSPGCAAGVQSRVCGTGMTEERLPRLLREGSQ